MSELFEGAVSQQVDNSGKVRAVTMNYGGGLLTLMTSPLPPTSLPLSTEIAKAKLKSALKFIKERGLEIQSQDGNEEVIQGLWVQPLPTGAHELSGRVGEELYSGYIPIDPSKPLEGTAFAPVTKNEPIRTESTSDLDEYRRNRRVAEYLKAYVLYTYARDLTFNDESITVRPKHVYEIEKLNKRFVANEVMYHKGKLVATSEEIKRKLLYFLETAKLNDPEGVLKMAQASTIESGYQTIRDFRQADQQVIFMNQSSLKRWKEERSLATSSKAVSGVWRPDYTEPYFYRSPKIRGNALMIVQNVNGDLEMAKLVSYLWVVERRNVGSEGPDREVPGISYVIYEVHGEKKEVKGETKEMASVVHYGEEDYGAVLFL